MKLLSMIYKLLIFIKQALLNAIYYNCKCIMEGEYNKELTKIFILGFSGGPLCGIVNCFPAPHSLNPTKFLEPKRKS